MKHLRILLATAALFAQLPAATAQPAAPPKADDDHKAHHPADAAAAPGAAPSAAQPTGTPPMGMMGQGMMGQGMMGPEMGQMMQRMMPMMRAMMARGGMERMDGPMGMMAPRRVEGRIAFLRTELGITDAQLPAWNAFADALRAQARSIEAARARMAGHMTGAAPAPGQPTGRPPAGMSGGMPPAGRPGMPPGMPPGMMAMPAAGDTPFPDQADLLVQTLTARLEAARAIAASGRALYAVLDQAQRKTADELLAMPMRGM